LKGIGFEARLSATGRPMHRTGTILQERFNLKRLAGSGSDSPGANFGGAGGIRTRTLY
jgi:hypothetical protein